MDPLQELIAEREIRKLIALSAQYSDDANIDGWANLYAENAVVVSGPKRLEGREALKPWITKVLGGPKMRHLLSNIDITVESPTTATATADNCLLIAEGGKWMVASSPRYNDKLVKTADGWKIQERVFIRYAP